MMEDVLNKIQIEKYSEYKYSGIEWLGDIPKYWSIMKLKFMGGIFAGINGKKGDDFSKEFSRGMKPFITFTDICNNLKIQKGLYQYVWIFEKETQNRVQKNDILFLMSSETLEEIGKCSIFIGNCNELYLNSFCKGFRIKTLNVNPEYLNYLLSSTTYRRYFSLVGRGFTRINIRQEYLNDAYAILPSLKEQTSIAQFLDSKTNQIDSAIIIKEKQIELLKERKQILTQNAVTRGLNAKAKMKDNAVDWIGKIPEHWKVVTNRELFSERNEPGNDNLQILSVSIHDAVSSEELSGEENIRGKIRIKDKSYYKYVRKNDIAFNMMRAWQGAIGAVRTEGMVSPAYIVAKTNKEIDPDFFEFQYRTPKFIEQMGRVSKGITDFRKRLYWNEFKALKTILPPKREQMEISSYIKLNSDKIDFAMSCKRKEIEKLQEYKSTLINSAVTGKIKVS